jgi:hypothetical protein
LSIKSKLFQTVTPWRRTDGATMRSHNDGAFGASPKLEQKGTIMTSKLHGALRTALVCGAMTLASAAVAQPYYVHMQPWTDRGFSSVGSPRANNGTPATTSAFVGGGLGVGNPSSVVTSPTAVSYTRNLNGPVRHISPNAIANADESANGYSVAIPDYHGIVRVEEPTTWPPL